MATKSKKAKPAKKSATKAKSSAKPAGKKPLKAKAAAKPAKKNAKKTAKPAAKAKKAAPKAPKVAAKSKSTPLMATVGKKSSATSAVQGSVKAAPAKKTTVNWSNFFTPLDDRIVVLVEGPAEKTAGGLYIPSTVEDRPTQGQVLLAGRGKKDKKGRIRPMDVKSGEKVLFGTFAGMKMILNDQEVLMLREEDIMGVVD